MTLPPQPSNAGQPSTLDLSRLISAAQATTQALNNLNQTIAAIFPNGNTISGSAGAATGTYLSIIVNGTPVKIQLFNP